jgi:hypothetical protein
MHDLTPPAMAVFCIQRPLPVESVGDLATLALAAPLHGAELVGVLDVVGRTVLPLLGFMSGLGEEVCVGGFGEGRG